MLWGGIPLKAMSKRSHNTNSQIDATIVAPLPWQSRLPRERFVEHPKSVDDFKDWPQLDRVAQDHLRYLEWCGKQLRQNWLEPWMDIFAVGPFLKRSRLYRTIPFVAVVNYRRPYRHILALSQALAEPYLEFGILPDIHLLSIQAQAMLDETENIHWEKTKMVSVHWSKRL